MVPPDEAGRANLRVAPRQRTFPTKNPSKRFCIDGFDVGKHADGLETRMKPMTSLAEQAGFEPAEGY
jgi:hypothetical protein